MARRNTNLSFSYWCEPTYSSQFKCIILTVDSEYLPVLFLSLINTPHWSVKSSVTSSSGFCVVFRFFARFFVRIFTNINWFANCWTATVDQKSFCFESSSVVPCLLAVCRWAWSSADWTLSSPDAFLSAGCCRTDRRHPFPSIVSDREVAITLTRFQRSVSVFHLSSLV